jgi:hypothetical protein
MGKMKKYADIREELKILGMNELILIAWSGGSVFNRLTQWFTRGKYSHMSILAIEMLPNGTYANAVMHFEATGRGIIKSRVSHSVAYQKYGVVYRVTDAKNVNKAYDWLLSQVDKEYDYRQLVFDFILTQATRTFGERVWQGFLGSKLRRFYEVIADEKYICSELASRAIEESGGHMKNIYDTTPAGFIDPNMLMRHFNLVEVYRFEK